MKIAKFKLTSAAPLSQSRKHGEKQKEGELAGALEERTWRSKMHVSQDGMVCIPAFALKCAIVAAAKYSGRQIPGKGKSTWTKKIQSGTMITSDIVTGTPASDAEPTRINANSDGVRGSGKRVERIMPTIHEWSAVLEIVVLDESITPDVLSEFVDLAGKFIGVGQYRPENGGANGRFGASLISFE